MMPTALLLGAGGFALAMSITPGPNNIMLASSGATFGLAATRPHILGVVVGFPVMMIAVGFGLASFFQAFPEVQLALKVASVVYLLWLAFNIAKAGSDMALAAASRPLTFWQSAAFQWINPKGWVIAVGAITSFTVAEGGGVLGQVVLIAGIDAVISLLTSLGWAVAGVVAARRLKTARARRTFNLCMAALLVASIAPTAVEMVGPERSQFMRTT